MSTSQASTYCLLSQTHASSTMSSLPKSHHNYSPNPLVVTKYNIQAGTVRWVVHPSRESVCTFEVKVFKSLLMSELKRHIEGMIPNQGKNLQILAHIRTQKREKGNIANQGKNLQILAHVRT